MRQLLAIAVVVASFGAAAPGRAAPDCTTYSLKAPVIGSEGGTGCVPIGNPSIFSMSRTVWDCPDVPPAGVSGCVSVTVWVPF